MEALEEDNRALRWRVGELEASVRMLLLYMNNRDDDAPRRRRGCQQSEEAEGSEEKDSGSWQSAYSITHRKQISRSGGSPRFDKCLRQRKHSANLPPSNIR